MIIIILLLFSQSLEGRIPVSHEISLDHGNKTVEFLAWLFLPLNLCLFGQRNCWTDGIGVTMYCFDIYSYNNDCDLIDQIHCKSIKFRVVTKISSCQVFVVLVRSLSAKYRPDRYRRDKSVKFGTELP